MTHIIKTCPTYEIFIHMAGDVDQAKQVCREFCFEKGFCVTVTPQDFIYTGGEEPGFRIGIMNYPRFPSERDELHKKAKDLAELLRVKLCQHSFSIVTPPYTIWESHRPQ